MLSYDLNYEGYAFIKTKKSKYIKVYCRDFTAISWWNCIGIVHLYVLMYFFK